MNAILLGFVTLLVSFLGALFVSKYAHLLGLLDKPNARSSHAQPTPKGGGIGILIAFCLASFLLHFNLAFWLPPAILAIVSLYGDKVDLSFKLRLVVQFVAAFWHLFTIYPFFEIQLELLFILYIVLVAIFIVGTANFYNFMDGINGIAGGTGVVAFGFLSYVAFMKELPLPIVLLPLMVALSCLGFLPLNIPKAKTFMGDVGSILLGFLFAAYVIRLAESPKEFILFAGFLFPFYADELASMWHRIRQGQSLTKAHRSHVYQLLANEQRIEHFMVSTYFCLAQLIISVILLHVADFGFFPTLFVEAALFCGFTLWAGRIKALLLNH